MRRRPWSARRSPCPCRITAGGILVSLGTIATTFPLLARITGPEAAKMNDPVTRMAASPRNGVPDVAAAQGLAAGQVGLRAAA
jgi:hypothetical protein